VTKPAEIPALVEQLCSIYDQSVSNLREALTEFIRTGAAPDVADRSAGCFAYPELRISYSGERPGAHPNRAFAISSDGAETFSQNFTFATDLVTSVVEGSTGRMSATDTGGKYNRLLFAAPSLCGSRKELRVHSSFDEGANWTGTAGSLLVWGQDAAYSDMVPLSESSTGVIFEAGTGGEYRNSIRYATVTEAALGAPACGGGYSVIDSKALGTAGTVYLSYNATSGKNCVSTMKSASTGTGTATSAYLEVKGAARVTDSGSFSYFAGPVSAAAADKCVKWGGATGGASFDSEFEHCS